jgi:hypothetical protein
MEPDIQAIQEPAESIEDFIGAAFDAAPVGDPESIDDPEIQASDEAAPEGAAADADQDTTADKAVDDADVTEDDEPDADQIITAPQSMSAKDREAFYQLPPDQQKWLTERVKQQESDYTRKTMELAETRKGFDKLEQVIAPRRQQLAMDGMDESTAIGQLFALSDFARDNPVGFVQHLFQQRGIPLSALTETGVGDSAYADPQLTAMQREIHGLKDHFTQQAQAHQEAQARSVQTEIEAFANDPANAYYAELEADMVPLVAGFRQSHPGLSSKEYLAKAYKAALAVNDEVSAKVKADNAARTEAARIAKAKKDAERAKRASSTNIRTSPALPAGAVKAANVDDFIGALVDERMAG